MANTASAKKRIRQNIKRRARNRWRKDQIKEAIRQFDQALREGDKTKASEQLKTVYKRLDVVASKGTLHKNTVSRKKSRLARRLAEV